MADCGAAAILLREGSDSNTIAENDLSGSSIGVLRITGQSPLTRASVGNLVYRNDASLASGGGLRRGHTWNVTFLENRGDSAAIGFRLDQLNGGLVRGQHGDRLAHRGHRRLEHGGDNTHRGQRAARRAGRHRVDGPGPRRRRRAAATGSTTTCWPGWSRGSCCRASPEAGCGATCSTGVGDGLVVDGAGHGTEVTGNVFLRATAVVHRRAGPGGRRELLGDRRRRRAPPRRCEDASACCRGSRRARRGTSEDLLRQRVQVAQVERLPRARHGPVRPRIGRLAAVRTTSGPAGRSGRDRPPPARARTARTGPPSPRVRDDQVVVALLPPAAGPARPTAPPPPRALPVNSALTMRCTAGVVVDHEHAAESRPRARGCGSAAASLTGASVERQGDPELGATLGRRLVSSARRRAPSPARS